MVPDCLRIAKLVTCWQKVLPGVSPKSVLFRCILKMSLGFGFSVGDIITGLTFIKQAIDALHDTKGAASDYQALIEEVDGLKDGLQAIQDLKLDHSLGSTSKQSIAIEQAVSRCQRCIDAFLATIAKYQPWLHTKIPTVLVWKINVKKIKWALCKKEDVRKFRSQLERHSSSINMLLLTLQMYEPLLIKHIVNSCSSETSLSHNRKSKTKAFRLFEIPKWQPWTYRA